MSDRTAKRRTRIAEAAIVEPPCIGVYRKPRNSRWGAACYFRFWRALWYWRTSGTRPLAHSRVPTASQAWLLLIVVILVCLGFFPTLVHDYVPQDQWRAFRYSLADDGVVARARACTNMIPSFYLLTGRPLVWIGECLEHAWVARIHDFAALRPVVLLMVVGTVFALGRVLSRVMGSFAAGVTVAAVAVLTPGYSFMYFQGLTGGPVVLSLLFATVSFSFLMQADDGLGRKAMRRVSARTASSLLFFLLACFIYPAFAFVWAPLALAYLGFDQSLSVDARMKRCLRTVLFYGMGSVLYYVFIKAAIALFLGDRGTAPAQYVFSVTSEAGLVFTKLKELFLFFYQSTTVANFFSWPGYVKVALLLAPAFFVARRAGRAPVSSSGGYRVPVLYVVVIPFVMVLGAAPWLLSHFAGITHRHTMTLQLLLVFSIGFLVRGLSGGIFSNAGARQVTEFILLVALLVPAAFQQIRLSMTEVMQSDTEIRYMRSALRQLIASGEFSQLQQYHVIRPDPGMDYVGWSRSGKAEVSQPATSANPEHISQMVTALLRELLPNEALRSLKIVDCRLNAECVRALARPGVLVLSQSAANEEPQLLERSFVLDYRLIQVRPSI